MIHRRGGATTSLVLGIAGVIGVGVAGGMALTGTTPCSIMSACGFKSEAKVETVAMTGEATACPVTGRAGAIAASTGKSDCCAGKNAEAPTAQTVALAAQTIASAVQATAACDETSECSNDPECAIDDGIACSTKGADCHKVQPANAEAVKVHVVTASQTEAKTECAMASSCSPTNCTEDMMKACTDSGKICPEDKAATPVTPATPATPVAQTVSHEAKAGCCSDEAKKAETVVVAPDALRPLYTLQFSGKGMPMLIPAAMTTQSACETKEAGSCGGEKKAACAATATTASLN